MVSEYFTAQLLKYFNRAIWLKNTAFVWPDKTAAHTVKHTTIACAEPHILSCAPFLHSLLFFSFCSAYYWPLSIEEKKMSSLQTQKCHASLNVARTESQSRRVILNTQTYYFENNLPPSF